MRRYFKLNFKMNELWQWRARKKHNSLL